MQVVLPFAPASLSSAASCSVAAAAIAWGAGLAPQHHELCFAPEPGETLVVNIEHSTRTASSHSNWCPLKNDVRVEEEAFNYSDANVMEYQVVIAFEDTYGPRLADQPGDAGRTGIDLRLPYQSLSRSFRDIGGELITFTQPSDDEDEEQLSSTEELSSPLSGRTVQFTWSDAAKDFEPTFKPEVEPKLKAARGGPKKRTEDAILLKGLHVDGSGDWFLPPRKGEQDIQINAGWEVPVSAWYAMLDVGGYFWIGPKASDPPSFKTVDDVTSINAQLLDKAEGRIACQLREVRVVDGRRLAVISIKSSLKSKAVSDQTDQYLGEREKVTETLEQTIRGEGECLWDIEAKRCHSIAIRSESTDRVRFMSTYRKNASETEGVEVVSVEESVSTVVFEFSTPR